MAQFTGWNRHKYLVERFNETLDEAHQLLIRAADEWAKGHPEHPPTLEVLNDLLELFEAEKFLVRPYGSNHQNVE